MSGALQLVRGDLLSCGADVIVQQCNCLTVRPHGLSKQIASVFPYADLYAQRKEDRTAASRNVAVSKDRGRPGTVVLCDPPPSGTDRGRAYRPRVACLLGQYDFGRAVAAGQRAKRGRPDDGFCDTADQRVKWFREALGELLEVVERGGRVPLSAGGSSEAKGEPAEPEPEPRLEPESGRPDLRVAFPYQIGCGLAGGNWSRDYLPLLEWFAERAAARGIKTILVQLPSGATASNNGKPVRP